MGDIKDYNVDQYLKFMRKHGYIPKYFDLYNARACGDIALTLSSRSGGGDGEWNDVS